MPEAFSAYPDLFGIRSERTFSLPQQNYLIAQFILNECRSEAQQRFESDYSDEQTEQMDRHTYATLLDGYLEQCGYSVHLDTFIEARRQLLEWGIEQLQKGPQTMDVRELLERRDLLQKRPRLQEKFLDLCMRMKSEGGLSQEKIVHKSESSSDRQDCL